MSADSPSIIIRTRFKVGSEKQNHMKELDKFIDYMARQDALSQENLDHEYTNEEIEELKRIENAISNLETENPVVEDLVSMEKYIDYMTRIKAIKVNEDREIVNGAFSSRKKNVTKDDIEKIKKDVIEAQQNNAVMFQDVVSFNNDFLIKQGYYDPETEKINEDVLYEAVSNMAKTCIEKEDLKDAFWFSTIHRNTDNIHIHFTMMERKNTREMMEWDGELQARGKRKPKTLDDMKHSFGNTLLNLKNEYAEISKIRTDLPKIYQQDFKEKLLDMYFNNQHLDNKKENKDNEYEEWLSESIEELKKEIPANTRGYNELPDSTKEKIDQVTLQMTKDNSMRKEYFKQVNNIDETLRETYGDSHKSGSYYKGREQVLNERLGNSLVREIKKMKKAEESGDVKKYLDNKNMKLNPSFNSAEFSFKTTYAMEKNKNYLEQKTKREQERNRMKKFYEEKQKVYKNKKDIRKIDKALNSDPRLYRAEQEYEEVQRKIMMEQRMREQGFEM